MVEEREGNVKLKSISTMLSSVIGMSMVLAAGTPSAVAEVRADPDAATQTAASTSTWDPASRAPGRSPDGSADRWIQLITGDRISVDAEGDIVSLRPAKGREGIPVRVESTGGHTYAVPEDVRSLITGGRLDRRLFDVTTLSEPAYAKAGLRLIVMYESARPVVRTALRSVPEAEVHRTLSSINADAITTSASGSARLWSEITDGPARAGDRTVAAGIASVWLDAVVQADLDRSVPQIGGPDAWAAGFDGTGSRIAVLDSGVDTTHPDLAGQVVAERNFSDAPDTRDLYGHGTHVASIAAGTGAKSDGKYKGVAPGARVLSAKVLNDTGSGTMSQVIAGMEWAVSEKADVANLSLGHYNGQETDPMEAAVNTLSAESETLFVIAAGNTGDQGPGSVTTPGSADAALTVGAVDKQDHLAAFSSVGPRNGDGAIKPDLTAPGVDIGAASAQGSRLEGYGHHVAEGYVALSGTSMASPHVAGAAAVLAQQHPDWDGDDLKAALVGSTTAGQYSAFQQGSGRVDLHKAIKQSLFAREASLSFGIAQWPHTDDQPLAKNLTYRNTGDAPVTLTLTVDATGPDGEPAPRGMFTVDDQVTVPAHGQETVKVTADTRTGDVTGAFTGRITATGGGQTVGTAVAVERESEHYTVTLRTLDRTGKPAASWAATLAGLTGPDRGLSTDLSAARDSVRLPKGRYFLNSLIRSEPQGTATRGVDWLNQPSLEVTEDITVTVDARTAEPIDVTVPDRSAYQTWGHYGVANDLPDGTMAGFSYMTASFEDFRTAHLGPKGYPGDRLSQQLSLSFSTGATGEDEYHLVYLPEGDRYLTGFTHHTRPREYAEVEQSLGAAARNKSGFVTPTPVQGGSGYGAEHPLPYHGTLHLLSADTSWWMTFKQIDANDGYETAYGAPARTFRPGHSYKQEFNVGVFGPDLPNGGAGLFRADEALDGDLPLFSDRRGNSSDNQSPVESSRTSVYRNGELVRTSIYPMDLFYIADNERADYRVTVTVDRGAVADVSTSLTTSWTFASEYAPGRTQIPTSVVRFTPALSLENTSKAGVKVRVPVSVKGSAAGRNLGSLTVWVSYDRGNNWRELRVHNGSVQVANPKAGGSVSFKAKAVDRQGNTVDETIIDAYLTK
ncbi:subtilase family protein [Streptomyces sp. T12]|nr:subtilase family protein [Streptomyces sp. T12]